MVLVIIASLILFIATIGSILLTFIMFKNSFFDHKKKYDDISFQYFSDYSKNLKN
jgi:hypothetical protein